MIKSQGAVRAPGQRAGGMVALVDYNEAVIKPCKLVLFMTTMII
jgi:hypothetical protein